MTKDDFQALMDRAKSSPSGGMPAYKTVEQGAATSVWAATAPELDAQGGTYLADAEVTDQHAPWARDPASAERLWWLTERPRRPEVRLLTSHPALCADGGGGGGGGGGRTGRRVVVQTQTRRGP